VIENKIYFSGIMTYLLCMYIFISEYFLLQAKCIIISVYKYMPKEKLF